MKTGHGICFPVNAWRSWTSPWRVEYLRNLTSAVRPTTQENIPYSKNTVMGRRVLVTTVNNNIIQQKKRSIMQETEEMKRQSSRIVAKEKGEWEARRFGDSPEDAASEEEEPREQRGTDVLMAKQACWRTWPWSGSLSAAGAASILLVRPQAAAPTHWNRIARRRAIFLSRAASRRGRVQGRHWNEEGGGRRGSDNKAAGGGGVAGMGWVAVFRGGGSRVASCRLATSRHKRPPHLNTAGSDNIFRFSLAFLFSLVSWDSFLALTVPPFLSPDYLRQDSWLVLFYV
jgi:hypothetical protein